MAKDSLLEFSPAGTLRISTPQGTACVRLDHLAVQILGAMARAITADATKADLRLADHAQALPCEMWPQIVKRASSTVRVRVPR